MKHLIIFIVVTINLMASDFINISLSDYIATVSRINKINIVVDENIDNKITFLISKDLKKKTYFEVLKNLLINKDLLLQKHKDFYLITKNSKSDLLQYFSIKLNFIKFEDIENFLKVYEDTIKYQFISTSKLLVLKSTQSNYITIKKFINSIDTLPKQLKLKVTIIDTNIEKVKELGLEYSLENTPSSNFFYNLIAYPFTISNDIPSNQKSSFYNFLKLVNTNGITEFISSPILTLSDNKELNFDVSTNIPYETGKTIIDDNNAKTTTALDYRDIGLKIELLPTIYNDNLVYVDLDLEVSNIISNQHNTPITSKKHIKQSFYLDTNKIFTLTGINQTNVSKNTSGIPWLMDLSYIGWLFKYETNNKTNSNLSIFLEVINPNEKKTIPITIIDNHSKIINNISKSMKKEYSK